MWCQVPRRAAVDTVTLNTVIKLHNGLQRAVNHQKGSSGLCGHPPLQVKIIHTVLSAFVQQLFAWPNTQTHPCLLTLSVCDRFSVNVHSADLYMVLISLMWCEGWMDLACCRSSQFSVCSDTGHHDHVTVLLAAVQHLPQPVRKGYTRSQCENCGKVHLSVV